MLGASVGGASAGTFLGVPLAYGMAGPVAARMTGVVEETGRKMAPNEHMPSFQEREAAVQAGQL